MACPSSGADLVFNGSFEQFRDAGGASDGWQTVGDEAMNRCKWRSERAATEHIVKFAAVTFAHGVRKIFFHAGTCGTINAPDAGGVLFEYGGAPRKMYSGVAAFTKILGVPDACVKTVNRDGLIAYVFRAKNGTVAIAWRGDGRRTPVALETHVHAFDIMGNELEQRDAATGDSPVYLVGEDEAPVIRTLEPLKNRMFCITAANAPDALTQSRRAKYIFGVGEIDARVVTKIHSAALTAYRVFIVAT